MSFRARRGVPELLGELVAELQQHGVQVLGARAYRTVGLVSMPGGLTIWCYGHLLRWRQDGTEVIWPAADAYGAARRLAELARRTASERLPIEWLAAHGSYRQGMTDRRHAASVLDKSSRGVVRRSSWQS